MKTLEQLGISPAPWKASGGHWIEFGDYSPDDEFGAYQTFAIPDTEEASANARLIAAAPMLYKYMREAVVEMCHECETKAKCCPHKFDGGCFVTKWRGALAAAGGEEEK